MNRSASSPAPDDGSIPPRGERIPRVALALLGLGAAIRILVTYPVHKYLADGDSLLPGMQALQILDGARPVFFASVRLGALESYLTAIVFALFGVSRETLAAVPCIAGILLVWVSWLFWRELLGAQRAWLPLLLSAVVSPSFLFWAYMPNSYAFTFLLCGTTLWLAARAARLGTASAAGLVGLGVAVGLGWWQSALTMTCSAPALVWLGFMQPSILRSLRSWALGIAGVALGAAPWLVYNLRHQWVSFHESYGAKAASGFDAIRENAAYFFTYKLPEVIAPVVEGFSARIDDPLARIYALLRWPVLAFYLVAAIYFLFVQWRDRRRPDGAPANRGGSLLVGVFLVTAVFNAVSAPGSFRGLTARYALPIALVLPGVVSYLLFEVHRRSRATAWLLISGLVVFNTAGYHWPGRSTRQDWRASLEDDRALIGLLDARGVEVVVGGYWQAYPINFLSRERIVAVPCAVDYYNYAARIRDETRRWALIGPPQVADWAQAAGVRGDTGKSGSYTVVFFDQPIGVKPAELLGRLLATCNVPQ